MKYTVHSEWDPYGVWVTTCREVPNAVTQSKRLDLVLADVAELLSLATGTEVTRDDIVVEWSAPSELEMAAKRTRQLREDAADLAERANAETVATVQRLHDEGFSVRDAGAMVGVSYQYAARVVRRHRERPAA